MAAFNRLATELKKIRESKKVTRSKVAKQLHVPISTVTALENPSLSDIPPSYQEGLYRRYGALFGLSESDIDEMIDDVELHKKRTQENKKGRASRPFIISSTIQRLTATVVILAISSYALWQFIQLFSPPVLTVSGEERTISYSNAVVIEGSADSASVVYINADPITLDENGNFQRTLYLQPGFNSFVVSARNNFAREQRVERVIIFETDENRRPSVDEQG